MCKPKTENDCVNASQTICWLCANAVPCTQGNKVGGRYIRGCNWSIYGQKVDGWTAKEHKMVIRDKRWGEREVTSFEVLDCPEFVRG